VSAPFQPGDCVECIDASPRGGAIIPIHKFLVQGAVYLVSDVIDHNNKHDGWSLRLAGIPVPDPMEGWNYRRFRKIDDDATEDFREQLRSPGNGEPSRHSRVVPGRVIASLIANEKAAREGRGR